MKGYVMSEFLSMLVKLVILLNVSVFLTYVSIVFFNFLRRAKNGDDR